MALDLTDWTDAAKAKVEKQPFFLFGHQTMVVLIRKSRVLPTYWILSSGNTMGPNFFIKTELISFLNNQLLVYENKILACTELFTKRMDFSKNIV